MEKKQKQAGHKQMEKNGFPSIIYPRKLWISKSDVINELLIRFVFEMDPFVLYDIITSNS